MGVNDINFLNLKTKLRISSKEAAVRRKTLRCIGQATAILPKKN